MRRLNTALMQWGVQIGWTLEAWPKFVGRQIGINLNRLSIGLVIHWGGFW
jgi:hypothetical protein